MGDADVLVEEAAGVGSGAANQARLSGATALPLVSQLSDFSRAVDKDGRKLLVVPGPKNAKAPEHVNLEVSSPKSRKSFVNVVVGYEWP